MNLQVAEFLPPLQKRQLHVEGRRRHFSPKLPDERSGRCCCAPGCQQIVQQQHALPWADRVLVDFESIRPVFEVVGDPRGFPWQLLWFADGHKPGAQPQGHRRSQDKPRASIPATTSIPVSR